MLGKHRVRSRYGKALSDNEKILMFKNKCKLLIRIMLLDLVPQYKVASSLVCFISYGSTVS